MVRVTCSLSLWPRSLESDVSGEEVSSELESIVVSFVVNSMFLSDSLVISSWYVLSLKERFYFKNILDNMQTEIKI